VQDTPGNWGVPSDNSFWQHPQAQQSPDIWQHPQAQQSPDIWQHPQAQQSPDIWQHPQAQGGWAQESYFGDGDELPDFNAPFPGMHEGFGGDSHYDDYAESGRYLDDAEREIGMLEDLEFELEELINNGIMDGFPQNWDML